MLQTFYTTKICGSTIVMIFYHSLLVFFCPLVCKRVWTPQKGDLAWENQVYVQNVSILNDCLLCFRFSEAPLVAIGLNFVCLCFYALDIILVMICESSKIFFRSEEYFWNRYVRGYLYGNKFIVMNHFIVLPGTCVA